MQCKVKDLYRIVTTTQHNTADCTTVELTRLNKCETIQQHQHRYRKRGTKFLQEGAPASYPVGTNTLLSVQDARKVRMAVLIFFFQKSVENHIYRSADTVKLEKAPHLFGDNTKATIGHAVLHEGASSISRCISTSNDHIPANVENRSENESSNFTVQQKVTESER